MEDGGHTVRLYVNELLQHAMMGAIETDKIHCVALMTFYVQTWDEYHTKTLTLGIVNGPVEGILILVSVYALTGFLGGGHVWQNSILETLHVSRDLVPDFIYNLSFTDIYLLQGGVVLVLNTIQSAQNVIKARRARGDKSRGALLGLVPFGVTWTLIVMYLSLQPNILHNHLIPFVLFAGLINAYSVGQMITAHLVLLDFPYYNVLVLPLAYGVFDSLGPFLQYETSVKWLGWPSALGANGYQVSYMFCMLGAAVGVYGSFVVDVIVTICDYLDIWCLTIKHPYVEGQDEGKGDAKGPAGELKKTK
jgi:ethanolaminephosphotransferase